MVLLKQHHFLTIAHKVALICCCFLFLHAPALASEQIVSATCNTRSFFVLTATGSIWAIKDLANANNKNDMMNAELLCSGVSNFYLNTSGSMAIVTDNGHVFGKGAWSLLSKAREGGYGVNDFPELRYFMDNGKKAAFYNSSNLILKKDGTLWAWSYSDNGPVMHNQQPLLRDVVTFDSASKIGIVAVAKDGALWLFEEKMSITKKPKRLMQGIKDAAVSHMVFHTIVALDKNGLLYSVGGATNKVIPIAKNVTQVKGGGLGPVCFTTADNKLWMIVSYSEDQGDYPGGYTPQFDADPTQDIVIGSKKVVVDDELRMIVRILADNVVEFSQDLTTIVIKKKDGQLYAKGTFENSMPTKGTEENLDEYGFSPINVKLDATGLTPRYDLEKLAQNGTFKKTVYE